MQARQRATVVSRRAGAANTGRGSDSAFDEMKRRREGANPAPGGAPRRPEPGRRASGEKPRNERDPQGERRPARH
jgi:hypothetical protein